MGRETSRSETTLRDNVRLFVDFRDAPASQIYDYIDQLSELVRTVAVFTYLMIDARDRPELLKAIHDLQIDDYIYLDLDADHRLDQLGIDMFVTTSQRIHLYGNIQPLVSGRVKNLPAVINADDVSIDQILDTVRQIYLSPLVSS
jgi:hypothetical protein